MKAVPSCVKDVDATGTVVAGPSRQPLPFGSRFVLTHALIPLLVVLSFSHGLMSLGGDQWLADHLYACQGGQWLWRDAWLASRVLHQGGRHLSVLLSVMVLLATAVCWWRARRGDAKARAWRWPLLYLVLALAAGSTTVSVLKSLTQMDCPWSLSRYGGSLPFIGLFETRPEGMPRAACFPGGHASAGYAWVALYFLALMCRPHWRHAGLAVGLLAGLVFGLTQQLRGAHFLSHDLWSLAICWLVSLALFLWIAPKVGRWHAY